MHAQQPRRDLRSNSGARSEIVVVALPFSSLQLNPSIIEYLDLSSAQLEAIEKLMSDESRNVLPLMAKNAENERAVG